MRACVINDFTGPHPHSDWDHGAGVCGEREWSETGDWGQGGANQASQAARHGETSRCRGRTLRRSTEHSNALCCHYVSFKSILRLIGSIVSVVTTQRETHNFPARISRVIHPGHTEPLNIKYLLLGIYGG